ncbi:ketoacyl-ACP synthase III [bacterium]|nr:ketoacyl-ACP synthase III [bacterium]
MNLPTRSGILGVGTGIPETILSNADLEKMVETSDEWITSRTGVRERRILAEGETNAQFGAEAVRNAVKNAGLTLDDIDLIISCTFTPDYTAPNAACMVHSNLGLKQQAPAFDLNGACSGFVYGLQVADSLVRTGVYRNIAVIGMEAITRGVDFTDRNTCVLFGDGAGAAIVGAMPEGSNRGILSTFCGADGQGHDLITLPASGSAEPINEERLRDKMHCLRMNGREVFKFAVRILGTAMDEAMKRADMTIDDIDLLIPHQANIRIMDAAVDRFGIPRDRVVCNVERFGNTSAASIPLALGEIVESGRLKEGMTVGLVAFGAGLTYAASIVRW